MNAPEEQTVDTNILSVNRLTASKIVLNQSETLINADSG